MAYLKRLLFDEIKKWIDRKEIIAVKGPRQSGKSTLLKMIKEWLVEEKQIQENDIVLVSFEDRELLDKFSQSPKEFLQRYKSKSVKTFFLIDEAQYCKDIGQKLKLLYDTYEDVKFFITGSSSLELTQRTGEYLVGRLFSFELLPLNFYEFLLSKDEKLASIYLEKNQKLKELIFENKDFEVEKQDIHVQEMLSFFEEYVIFGGYPEVVKAKSEEEKKIIVKNVFNTYIEKDILAFLQIKDGAKFRKMVAMISFMAGNLISYEKLSVQCNTYFKEVLHFIDVLQQTYVIILLKPIHQNLITELRKTPKVYFIDSGLRNYAIDNFNKLQMRDDAGKLAENFVLNQLKEGEKPINFWRTTSKAEVDFIVNDLPIEVKFSSLKEPAITKSFGSFIKSYKPKNALIITKDFWGELEREGIKIKFVPICYI